MMKTVNSEMILAIEDCARRSHSGAMSFGRAVGVLAALGVEAYQADFRTAVTTYYLLSGETHQVTLTPEEGSAVAQAFDLHAVVEAIRGAQSGAVLYPEFVRRTVAGGCVGYTVWIAGRHVQYFGRKGERHVEEFPPAPPAP